MLSKTSAGPFFSSTRRVSAPISRSQSTSAVIRRSSPCCSRLAIHCRWSRKPIVLTLRQSKLDRAINSRNCPAPQWVVSEGRREDPRAAMSAAQIFDLHGRVALVTGASSGLGVRFAEVLAENGAAVVLVARRADRLKALQGKIEKSGGKALAVEADVVDREAMQAAFDTAEKAFGTVTILVNNAGVAHAGRAVATPEEE